MPQNLISNNFYLPHNAEKLFFGLLLGVFFCIINAQIFISPPSAKMLQSNPSSRGSNPHYIKYLDVWTFKRARTGSYASLLYNIASLS